MFRKHLFIFILLVLFGCQQEKNEWNPLFEETNFDYLSTQIERSLSLIDDAYSEENKSKEESIKDKVNQAKNRLLEIKNYYIPLTTIRQKTYDAGKYFKLNNVKKTTKLLQDSKAIISLLNMTTKNKVFDKVILDLNSMIDEVITSLDNDSKINTCNKMEALGKHVNLMLYRGDLVLSGIEFEK